MSTTPWFKTFRQRLAEALDAQGISKAELSRRTKIHVTTISRIIHGHLEPTLGTAEKLAESAGMTAEKLFDEKSSPNRKRTLTTP
jgi:transcriptional regulator with XRE-family HTH domain